LLDLIFCVKCCLEILEVNQCYMEILIIWIFDTGRLDKQRTDKIRCLNFQEVPEFLILIKIASFNVIKSFRVFRNFNVIKSSNFPDF
jgi:hypothetical protein